VQTICDAGYQKEIAGIATASKQVHVFSRVLVDAILLLHGEDESSLPDRFTEFARTCTGSQHTYLFAQALLRRAAADSGAAWIARLSQQLAEAIVFQCALARRGGGGPARAGLTGNAVPVAGWRSCSTTWSRARRRTRRWRTRSPP
jgi:hypothetical protein